MNRKERMIFRKNLYKKILKKKNDYYEVLVQLSNIYSTLNFYKKALEIDKKIVELSPSDPIACYNLACDYSIIGDIKKSVKWLKNAINYGYDDFEYMENDPDLENLRKSGIFKCIFNKNN